MLNSLRSMWTSNNMNVGMNVSTFDELISIVGAAVKHQNIPEERIAVTVIDKCGINI